MSHYRHRTDIDPEASIDADVVDKQVSRVVNPLALTFEQANLDETFRRLLADTLKQFLGTHKSIRLLMKSRKDNPDGMADAMSLAREQIEKVYVVVLLLENPETWTTRYFKVAWRQSYERYLLYVDEKSNLPRHKQALDQWRRLLEEDRQEFKVTHKEKEFVEFKYYNPGTRLPDHLKVAKDTIDNLPTPAGVIKNVSDIQLKEALRRWYKEYSYFSGYTHSGFRKLMPRFISANMKLTTSQMEKIVGTEYTQSIMISYLATVIACTEAACRALPNTDGVPRTRRVVDAHFLVELSQLWELMRKSALVSEALYQLRARHILPPILDSE